MVIFLTGKWVWWPSNVRAMSFWAGAVIFISSYDLLFFSLVFLICYKVCFNKPTRCHERTQNMLLFMMLLFNHESLIIIPSCPYNRISLFSHWKFHYDQKKGIDVKQWWEMSFFFSAQSSMFHFFDTMWSMGHWEHKNLTLQTSCGVEKYCTVSSSSDLTLSLSDEEKKKLVLRGSLSLWYHACRLFLYFRLLFIYLYIPLISDWMETASPLIPQHVKWIKGNCWRLVKK